MTTPSPENLDWRPPTAPTALEVEAGLFTAPGRIQAHGARRLHLDGADAVAEAQQDGVVAREHPALLDLMRHSLAARFAEVGHDAVSRLTPPQVPCRSGTAIASRRLRRASRAF